MTDGSAFSPAKPGFSLHPDLQLSMEEGSENSEQLIEEDSSEHEIDGEGLFGMESNVGNQVLDIEGNDLDDAATERELGFESNGLDVENDTNEQVLGYENNGNEASSEHMVEACGGNFINIQKGGEGGSTMIVVDDQDGMSADRKEYPPPVVGMEFESYDDAYNYYNCYSKEIGFAIRVKSSWTKRNSKEKRGAVLCCNCEGFKTMKEASTRRKETRTGCQAMLRLRLVESNRWRVDEVKVEHNHVFDPERAQNSKSHKKIDVGEKRKLEPALDVEVRTIKLYRTPAPDVVCSGSSHEREIGSHIDLSKRLKLGEGDAKIIYNYFVKVQLTDPNFFYIMDLTEEGYLKNVFWIDSRARAAYGYFGDVIAMDTTCLSNEYKVPLLTFVGVNHHGQSVLLGCALLVDETLETYVWLLRAWLTCMLGRPPQTVISDQCKALQTAISEVFPRASHRFCLPLVMKRIICKLGQLGESEVFRTIFDRTVNSSMKADEFESSWEEMIQHFGLGDSELLKSLYEERERWAPVYLKDTFFAGMYGSRPDETLIPIFDGYVHKQTTLKEFFDMYELFQQNKHQKEALDDCESEQSSIDLRTRYNYEFQLSELYTKEIFSKFQDEVELMSNCMSITQIHANGPVTTYMVKERDMEADGVDVKIFEVVYDKIGVEVRCTCSCFNFKGYLCRHSLCVLNYNGIEDLPSQYILSRWRKDFKRLYAPDFGSNNIDLTNPVQWLDHLYRRAIQVVQEGMTSQDHFMVAWQAFKESLNKVRLVADKHVQ